MLIAKIDMNSGTHVESLSAIVFGLEAVSILETISTANGLSEIELFNAVRSAPRVP
jgi:hypothetical protein